MNTALIKPILFFFFFFVYSVSFSQTRTKVESTHLVNLEVMAVLPEKPPVIEIVFKAQNVENNEPIWDLTQKEVLVYEDSVLCDIVSLQRISADKPINIALIIDHSGSMSIGWPTVKDIYNILVNDAKYVSPLDYAKKSASLFTSSFNFDKDNIGVVAFGSTVDLDISPVNDSSKILAAIDSIEIDGATAYFDGLMAGINQLKNREGINIIVSLTDGAENSSESTLEEVILTSNKYNIPIYTIGLGMVQKDTLSLIADSTKGEFYHTNSPSELNNIYAKISEQIQAYYAVKYKSKTLQDNKGRNVTIDFASESPFLKNVPNDPDVLEYLEKKKFNEQLKFYGKIAVGITVSVGFISLIYYRRRKKRLSNLKNQ